MEKRKGKDAIGTTKKGIGPSYAAKALRVGLRMGDLADWDSFKEKYDYMAKTVSDIFGVQNFDTKKELDDLKRLRERIISEKMLVDSVEFMHSALQSN